MAILCACFPLSESLSCSRALSKVGPPRLFQSNFRWTSGKNEMAQCDQDVLLMQELLPVVCSIAGDVCGKYSSRWWATYLHIALLTQPRRPSRRRISGLAEFFVAVVNPPRNIWQPPKFNTKSTTVYFVKIQYIWPSTILLYNDGCWQMT